MTYILFQPIDFCVANENKPRSFTQRVSHIVIKYRVAILFDFSRKLNRNRCLRTLLYVLLDFIRKKLNNAKFFTILRFYFIEERNKKRRSKRKIGAIL